MSRVVVCRVCRTGVFKDRREEEEEPYSQMMSVDRSHVTDMYYMDQ